MVRINTAHDRLLGCNWCGRVYWVEKKCPLYKKGKTRILSGTRDQHKCLSCRISHGEKLPDSEK